MVMCILKRDDVINVHITGYSKHLPCVGAYPHSCGDSAVSSVCEAYWRKTGAY